MKKYILLSLLSLGMAAQAEDHVVYSPNGKLAVTLTNEGGKAAYSVTLDGVTFLEQSPLGLTTNIGDYTRDMELAAVSPTTLLADDYEMRTIKQSKIHYEANRAVYTFAQAGKPIYDVEFQVSDNDIAFRYKLYQQGDTRCCVVTQEASGFALPAGSTTFLCPQAKPMVQWMRTSPSYETPYTCDDELGKNGNGEGYTFPCLFRNGENGWILISETGVGGNYCGCRLLGSEDGIYTIGFPDEGEFNGNGTACPGLSLPSETPWRTITVGETLAPIVETTIAWDVVKPLYEPSKAYQYGVGSWSWIIGMDESINFEEQQRYIDFTAAMGWQTVLVDNYWDTKIGRDGIEMLAKYGKEKGVDLYLWYNTNGYWNDSPQTPRNIMNNLIARRREMKWLQSIGVRGIKVDFMGSDKQIAMQLFEDIMADANEYGLLVIFHGCTIPRGWERMYPNYIASEAVLASENLHFAQSFCDSEAHCAAIHPYIRNTLGNMDFGGSTLNRYYNELNSAEKWGGKRVTSEVFALATAVLFQSPAQHFAMAPNNLTDAPSWAVAFMQEVPTTWDEVRYLAGYPGKYVILARRHGEQWFVAGINAADEPLKISIELPMFAAGEILTIYADDTQLQGSKKEVKLSKKGTISLNIPCNGGVVVTK